MQNRRDFLRTALASFVGPFLCRHSSMFELEATGPTEPVGSFETVGLYASLPTDPPPQDPRVYDFFKACGYNYLEFCEGGFRYRPDLLPEYCKDMSRAIALAHDKGLRVGIVLLAGMEQWTGPDTTVGAHFPGVFSPRDTTKLNERFAHLRYAVSQLRDADVFVFLPGDPGGDPEGNGTLEDCVSFTRQVQQIVRQQAPRATFILNLWAIAQWEGFPSPSSLRFWEQEIKLSRAAVATPGLLGPRSGVSFPLHNYYRSLTLSRYSRAGLKPEQYPAAQDIQALRKRAVSPLLGWPYFLVDEADDGYVRPNNHDSGGQSSCETRYIRALVDIGLRLGLDGLVASAIFREAESLNIYAFGQMCRSAELTPERVIDQYAGFVADEKTKGVLGRVLRFIENNSNWQISLPVSYRLKDFDLPHALSATVALDLLAQVKPCVHPAIPLLEPPAIYLGRLKKRLQAIAEGLIGGFSDSTLGPMDAQHPATPSPLGRRYEMGKPTRVTFGIS